MMELSLLSGMIIIVINYWIFLSFIIIDSFFDTELVDSFLPILLYTSVGGGCFSIFTAIIYICIGVLK